jgi:peptidoglycan biosynthesis protein MviN/MurJ (putative lipid II flippase)
MLPTKIPHQLQLSSIAINELLLDLSLSIIAFLKFPLLVILGIDSNIPVKAYFSYDQLNVEDLNKIKSIPLPPSSLLQSCP